METLETCDDFCRMCLTDLTSLPEYYAIDEDLGQLVQKLTEIAVDFCFDFQISIFILFFF
jgi:hypothetical protein